MLKNKVYFYSTIFGCQGAEVINLDYQRMFLDLLRELIKISEFQNGANSQRNIASEGLIKLGTRGQLCQSLDELIRLGAQDTDEMQYVIQGYTEQIDRNMYNFIKMKYKQAKNEHPKRLVPIFSVVNAFMRQILKFEDDQVRQKINQYFQETSTGNRFQIQKLQGLMRSLNVAKYNEPQVFSYFLGKYYDFLKESKRRQKSDIVVPSKVLE